MNVARHYGLQLPEFPYETVTFSRGRALQFDCANALSAGETTLVRCVDMYDETPATHLLELLRMVDGEHQQLAEIGETNGSFVMLDDYQWGLTRLPDDQPALQQRWAHNLVPEGHALVAQVPLVPHERRAPTYDQQTQLATIATVYRQGKQSGDVMLNNIYALQFVPRQPDCMPVYVDIDPYLVVVK